jgi:four helix bundle protein
VTSDVGSKKMLKSHKDLVVWQKSIELVSSIYLLTQSFPEAERFGLISQLRRASVSVPSNIAEGAARNSKKEFIQFLYISLGSLSEIETQLIIAEKLKLIDDKTEVQESVDEIRKLILGLIRSLKRG